MEIQSVYVQVVPLTAGLALLAIRLFDFLWLRILERSRRLQLSIHSPIKEPFFLENGRETLRLRVDTVADELLERHSKEEAFRILHKKVFSNIPEWVDPEMLKQGQDVFWLHFFPIVFALGAYSLPVTYLCADGAEVLACTGRFKRGVPARLLETAAFVYGIMIDEDVLGVNGRGRSDVINVRLLHAKVRRFLLHNHGWESTALGAPINHEDQAGTLVSFSYLTIMYCESLGLSFTDQERKAYHHVWRYVGWALGIPEEMLTEHYSNDRAYAHAILTRNIRITDVSSTYVDRLFSATSQKVFLLRLLPTCTWSASFRLAGGEEISDSVKLPHFTLWSRFRVVTLSLFVRGWVLTSRVVHRLFPAQTVSVIQNILHFILLYTGTLKPKYELELQRTRESMASSKMLRASLRKALHSCPDERHKLRKSVQEILQGLDETALSSALRTA